jgi:hypothetical protein
MDAAFMPRLDDTMSREAMFGAEFVAANRPSTARVARSPTAS